MVIRHVCGYSEFSFEKEVQKVINEVLLEEGCFMKLIDIKYSPTRGINDNVEYSALLIFE
jgi:hypothetical protein